MTAVTLALVRLVSQNAHSALVFVLFLSFLLFRVALHSAGMAAEGADPAMGHQQQNGGIDDATGRASYGGSKHQGEVELAKKVDMEVCLCRDPLPAVGRSLSLGVVLQLSAHLRSWRNTALLLPWGKRASPLSATATKLSAASQHASQCASPWVLTSTSEG